MSYDASLGMKANPRPTRTSDLVREFADSVTADRVTVGEIVAAVGDRGLGMLLAVFALPNVLPSLVFFGNVLTGVPPFIFAVQLALGLDVLILPRFIAKRRVSTVILKAIAPRVATLLSWFERLLTPRLSWVTGPRAERVFGVISMVLALVSILPVPFGHQLPALGLVLIGLGLIERDGLAILAGAIIGLIGTTGLVFVILGLARGFEFLMHIHAA